MQEDGGVYGFWQCSLITLGEKGALKDRADLVKIK